MPKFEADWLNMKAFHDERDAAANQAAEEAEARGDEAAAREIREAHSREWRPSGIDDNAAAFRAMFD